MIGLLDLRDLLTHYMEFSVFLYFIDNGIGLFLWNGFENKSNTHHLRPFCNTKPSKTGYHYTVI